jgi:hypothetical protein
MPMCMNVEIVCSRSPGAGQRLGEDAVDIAHRGLRVKHLALDRPVGRQKDHRILVRASFCRKRVRRSRQPDGKYGDDADECPGCANGGANSTSRQQAPQHR